MTKAEALFDFWSSFGLTAYEKNAVPVKTGEGAPDYPYITYECKSAHFGGEVALSASLWYRDTSWRAAEDKQQEISDRIGIGGIFLAFDGGVLWVRRETPFATHKADGTDEAVRELLLHISVEFWAEN